MLLSNMVLYQWCSAENKFFLQGFIITYIRLNVPWREKWFCFLKYVPQKPRKGKFYKITGNVPINMIFLNLITSVFWCSYLTFCGTYTCNGSQLKTCCITKCAVIKKMLSHLLHTWKRRFLYINIARPTLIHFRNWKKCLKATQIKFTESLAILKLQKFFQNIKRLQLQATGSTIHVPLFNLDWSTVNWTHQHPMDQGPFRFSFSNCSFRGHRDPASQHRRSSPDSVICVT